MAWTDLTDAVLTGDEPAFGSIPASYKARLEAGVAMPVPPIKFDSGGSQTDSLFAVLQDYGGGGTNYDFYVPENVNGTDGTNATGDTNFSFFLFMPIEFSWTGGNTPLVRIGAYQPDLFGSDIYSRGPQWSPDSGTGTYNPVLYCGLPAAQAGSVIEVSLLVNTTTGTATFEINPPVGGYRSLASIRRSISSSFT